MSSVRMCDGCGAIFSERAEGWAADNRTVNKRDDHGRLRPVTEAVDYCPVCAGAGGEVTPRIAIAAIEGAAVAAEVIERGGRPDAAEQATRAEVVDDHYMLRDIDRRLTEVEQRGRV